MKKTVGKKISVESVKSVRHFEGSRQGDLFLFLTDLTDLYIDNFFRLKGFG